MRPRKQNDPPKEKTSTSSTTPAARAEGEDSIAATKAERPAQGENIDVAGSAGRRRRKPFVDDNVGNAGRRRRKPIVDDNVGNAGRRRRQPIVDDNAGSAGRRRRHPVLSHESEESRGRVVTQNDRRRKSRRKRAQAAAGKGEETGRARISFTKRTTNRIVHARKSAYTKE
jgi:hypothetical protein